MARKPLKLRISVVETEGCTRNHYILLGIVDALRRNPHVEFAIASDIWSAGRDIRSYSCNSVLVVGSAGNNYSSIARLRDLVDRRALWTTEDPYEEPRNVAGSSWFDVVFSNDSSSVHSYASGAVHLPLAGSLLFNNLKPIEDDKEFLYDVLFIGTAWPNRVSEINEILTHLPKNLKLKIALSTNPYIPKPTLSRSEIFVDWRCSNRDFSAIANRSRVTLTLDRAFSSSQGGSTSGATPPPRIFELALAGAYQVYLSSRQEIENYFDVPDDIYLADDVEDAAAACLAAITNPVKRIQSAIAARDRALRDHTYDIRVGVIVDSLLKISPKRLSLNIDQKRNILLVAHNHYGREPRGGIEVYLEHYEAMHEKYNVYLLYPSTQGGEAALHVRTPSGSTVKYGLRAPVNDYAIHDPEIEESFAQILDEYDIDLVHIHHLIGFPLSLPLVASAFSIPIFFTLHDYYLVCRRFNLLDYTGSFCDVAAHSRSQCDICLSATDGMAEGGQARRREFISLVLRSVDTIIANTPYSKNYFIKMYPEFDAGRVKVVEMITPGLALSRTSRDTAVDAQELRVVIPGNFTREKGGDHVIRLMNLFRNEQFSFTVMGSINPDLAAAIHSLALPSVHVTGAYDYRNAISLLEKFDVSLHLSIWPETYLISLSESWAAGLVPIVYDIGAPGERVTSGVNGYSAPVGDIGAVADVLRMLAADRTAFSTIQKNIRCQSAVDPRAHFSELEKLYEAALPREKRAPISSSQYFSRLQDLALYYRTNSPLWNSAENKWDQQLSSPVIETKGITWLAQAPSVYSGLPIRISGVDHLPGFRHWIDQIVADKVALKRPITTIVCSDQLEIHGWAYAPGFGSLSAAYVRVVKDGLVRLKEVPLIERHDVRDELGDEDAVPSGFYIDLTLDGLQTGSYDISLIQFYARASVILPLEFKFQVNNHRH